MAFAVREAQTLEAGGADAIIVENFNDVPFRRGPVDAHTVAAMTGICIAVRDAVDCEVGVNVLRNDALAALGIAVASGASFIRVNIHTGAMATDQGLIQGQADETLRVRRSLGAERIEIFADVLVKHAVPLGSYDIHEAVKDATLRGLADAVIISGSATGKAALADEVMAASAEAGSTPVYVGSGVTVENVAEFIPLAAGVVVGTWLKHDRQVSNPVDIERVRAMRRALDILGRDS